MGNESADAGAKAALAIANKDMLTDIPLGVNEVMSDPEYAKLTPKETGQRKTSFLYTIPKLMVQTSTCFLGHQHDGNDGRGGTVKNMMGKDGT